MNSQTLYKYRGYTADSLALLVNREFYFSDPAHFNDPYDCQISISQAVQEAIEQADSQTGGRLKKKLATLLKLAQLFDKIEKDVKAAGIFSLSQSCDNVLMWSHYADEHRGFCIGLNLTDKLMQFNKEHAVIGTTNVHYFENNPFLEFFADFATQSTIPTYDEFWKELLALGLIAKSSFWSYEKEVRVIRGMPGVVPFEPTELVEIIFGLRINERHERTVRSVLQGNDWKHVNYRRIARTGKGFSLQVVPA